MANILSMTQMRKKCRVTMDTAIEPAMLVHRSNGTIIKFFKLYFFDAAAQGTNLDAPCTPLSGYVFVYVVSNNSRFHRHKVGGADVLHRKIGRPSHAQFEAILRNNQRRNCPVPVDDARRAITIYGPDRATLQGKIVKNRGANVHVPTFSPLEVPQTMMDDCTGSGVFSHHFPGAATMLNEINFVIEIYRSRGSPSSMSMVTWSSIALRQKYFQ